MIEEKLQSAIKSLSEKYNIDSQRIRIRISKPERDLAYHIADYNDIIEETNVATALNLNSIMAYAVTTKLNVIFNKLSEDNNIDRNKMDIRIYTKTQDCSPSLYLFNDNNPVKKIEVSEIV